MLKMNFYNDTKILVLNKDLINVLKDFRTKRNFNVDQYIKDKINKLNKYMNQYKIDTCIVAISGGVDSAVTYAIVNQAMQEEGSPIKKIVPIFLPVYNSDGATNQDTARNKAIELINAFPDNSLFEIDISTAHAILKETVDQSLKIIGKPWASGQLVSYLRTPTYYYVTSLLNENGFRSIICGTTNKDEGAYLGYFGKASDGMVDIQMIADIHKSEVYQVAIDLGVPKSILQAIPSGDMYDNRNDEEVFGAPYNFVEIYLNCLNLTDTEKDKLLNSISEDAKSQFLILSENLDKLHNYNKHKYLGASPAVHLDVIESKVNGGWNFNTY
jgi:NAD+ synthetase